MAPALVALAIVVAAVYASVWWESLWQAGPSSAEESLVETGEPQADEPVADPVASEAAADEPAVEAPQADEVSVEDVLPVREVSYTTWDPEASPNYWRMVGPAVVDVDIPVGEIWYAPLDGLGRTMRAAGTIDLPTVLEGLDRERGNLQGHNPSGWGHNERVEISLPGERSYSGYLWNRSHLVAKSLGGSDEVENLICGTRTQNVGANDGQGGMSYVEGLARDWLFDHRDQTLFFSATPAYEGDELVCRSVIVDLRSSDGQLDAQIEVYNAALGYRIDYATGEFWPA